ncbi:MAG: galactokinase [Spirochaetales bacterium]|nr:galactokinase [Spirochaetales bacterium]
MPTFKQAQNLLGGNEVGELLLTLYGKELLHSQRKRLNSLVRELAPDIAPARDIHIFSVPGRTELGGNHTDHNHGNVLAAAIHLDSVAVVSKTDNNIVELNSCGFQAKFKVCLDTLEPQPKERNTTESLIRGVAGQLKKRGYTIGGFRGCISSTIPVGSGLSSSAAFEILIGTIFDHLYNSGRIPVLELALISQYAENHYFCKPCGLMDQIACANGGIVAIDFSDPFKPDIETLHTNFKDYGYTLTVVNTGSDHADLTHEYTAIQQEMKATAEALGKAYCRDVSFESLLHALPMLRHTVGDRALLRSLHFLTENQRVQAQIRLLSEHKIDEYLEIVKESGRSSWMLLQNCYTATEPEQQAIPLALALTDYFYNRRSACRVHGGGFAGTIQAYIPSREFESYKTRIQNIFGPGSVIPLQLRQNGAVKIM